MTDTEHLTPEEQQRRTIEEMREDIDAMKVALLAVGSIGFALGLIVVKVIDSGALSQIVNRL